MMKKRSPPLAIVIGGIASLIIAMGIGRFSYTPILPILQAETGLTDSMAGYLASSNYLGYLLGALLANVCILRKDKLFSLRLYLIINIFTTLLMGSVQAISIWFILRFISGLTSGFVFVLASGIVLDALARYKRPTWSGLFYSGVGFGILLTGLIVPIADSFFGWNGAWVALGFIALAISIIVFLLLKEPIENKHVNRAVHKQDETITKQPALPWLIGAYGCEGIGYIVSATFLVALVQDIPDLSSFPSLSWIFVGAAAIPSCIIWALIARRWGNMVTLHFAFFTQMIGVILPVIFFNTYGALIGAFLFGATFMGITTLVVSEARALTVHRSGNIIGFATFIYGIGQMLGPTIAGWLIAASGSYHSSLIFASFTLLLAMVFLAVGQLRTRKFNKLILENEMLEG